ncbi:hypothetical protein ACFLY5_00525, partial [Patescibacteria group bacterium]
MPKHKPTKFESSLSPTIRKQLKEILDENKKAKTVINMTLALIAAGGILTTAVVAPGIVGELSRMRTRNRKAKYEEYREIWRRFHLLKQQGNLKFVKEK